MAIAQHRGHPHTPADQAWIKSFFEHIKGEWPDLEDIREARRQGLARARQQRLEHHRRTTNHKPEETP